jgi:hypothetical protein
MRSSEYRKKQEAKERAAKALQKTKKRLGIKPARALQGAKESPLVAKGWTRRPKTAPTSDRIPGSATSRDFMHAHKWKRGATETKATIKEIRRKTTRIAPAYNKGGLQYLPSSRSRKGTKSARR